MSVLPVFRRATDRAIVRPEISKYFIERVRNPNDLYFHYIRYLTFPRLLLQFLFRYSTRISTSAFLKASIEASNSSLKTLHERLLESFGKRANSKINPSSMSVGEFVRFRGKIEIGQSSPCPGAESSATTRTRGVTNTRLKRFER